ncbi:MAG: hypothetical protein MUF42_06695 [Cytophagaceae bacterium]|jgi:hypothetical protein|nr:hypothetical protein [Cytophagaceae bacterium]
MKNIYVFFCFIPGFLLAQSPSLWQDALALKKMVTLYDRGNQKYQVAITKENVQACTEISSRYGFIPTNNTASLPADLLSFWEKNEFFQIASIVQSSDELKEVKFNKNDIQNFWKENSGGFKAQNLADGLAKFLVERTKQELTIYFFQKFKSDLNKYDELSKLFPATWLVLSTIGEDIYLFEAYLNTLREAFAKDMIGFYENFTRFLEHPRVQGYFANRPEFKAVLTTSMYLIKNFSEGRHPGLILEEFDTNTLSSFSNLKNAMSLIQLLSTSLKSGGEYYWIAKEEWTQLQNNDTLSFIYLGLLYKNAEEISFSTPQKQVKVTDWLKTAKKSNLRIRETLVFLQSLLSQAKQINTRLVALQQSEAKGQQFPQIIDAFLEFISISSGFLELSYVDLGEEETKLKTQVQDLLSNGTLSRNLLSDIQLGNYGSAVISAVHILNACKPGAVSEGMEDKLKAFVEELNKDKSKKEKWKLKDFVAELSLAKLDSIANKYPALKSKAEEIARYHLSSQLELLKGLLLRYGTFASMMAQAKNSEDVKNAIATIALPAGSSLIKRETRMNVALNAYVGLFTGNENIIGIGKEKWFNSFGVTAPVGITLSKGHSVFFIAGTKKGWSSSLFISAIDIGTLVSYRFKNSTTTQLPELEWKHILSPGLFYSLGIPKSPLSITVGTQIGPNLRGITSGAADLSDAMYVRTSIALCVDIPLLNFYNRTERK